MKYSRYLKDKAGILVLNAAAVTVLGIFLYAVGNSVPVIGIILTVWMFTVFTCMAGGYFRKKKYWDNIYDILRDMDKKYLIGDVMGSPYRLDEALCADVIRTAGKSMLEECSSVLREREEYRDYIEQWIHEVKTPVAVMKLICGKDKSQDNRKLLYELLRTESYLEQVLYYARSANMNKDYQIREIGLSDTVMSALKEQKMLLISAGMKIQNEIAGETVFGDSQWIGFILSQLMQNAVQYCREDPLLHFSVRETPGYVHLIVEDNGEGIKAEELPRIFDKGFVGSNGRGRRHSTGIGLYLVGRMCEKLGIRIEAESEVQKYCRFILIFPIEKDRREMMN